MSETFTKGVAKLDMEEKQFCSTVEKKGTIEEESICVKQENSSNKTYVISLKRAVVEDLHLWD